MEPMAGGSGGGGGGPAPFLIKTYEMVDDSSTDEIVSWSSNNASFVVWNPPDFAANLLPTYFKHNNFSSFIRQLNTYGFRKIDPERWEFANEDFIKDHKHLLKNIHRRKPIHSHNHPPLPDSERIAFEEEIARLSREKAALTADLWRFKQQHSGIRIQLEDLERRVFDMEQRQAKMVAFLDRALHNHKFVDNLIKMAAGSGPAHFSSILHKKRRLPGLDYCLEIAESSFYDNNNTTAAVTSKPPDAGQVFNQDFCDKLKLGLCSGAISESDNNFLTASTQSSNEAGGSPWAAAEHNRNGNGNGNGNGRLECLSFVPDTLELSDTGTSLCPKKNSLFSESVVDDGDGLISCHLNLTLASSSMQIDKSGTNQNSVPEEAMGNREEDTNREATKNQSDAPTAANGNATSLPEAAQTGNQAPQAAPGRVNDVFWEQFLTERPGSSDTEEASSSLRADPSDDSHEERKTGNDSMCKNRKDMEQLTL